MRRPIALAALSFAALALPATASAGTVSVAAGCYLDSPTATTAQPIPFTGSGLTPGENVVAELSANGEIAGSVSATADAAGNLTGSITTWDVPGPGGPQPDVAATLTVTDPATATTIGTAPVTIDSLDSSVTSGSAKLGSKRTWEIAGLLPLTGHSTYYAYYFKSSKFKKGKFTVIGHQKLGKAGGTCGYMKAKRPLSPFHTPGKYTVIVEAQKTFSRSVPFVPAGEVTIFRF